MWAEELQVLSSSEQDDKKGLILERIEESFT